MAPLVISLISAPRKDKMF